MSSLYSPKPYRELLVSTVANIEAEYNYLLDLGMTLVMYEDTKAGVVPFENGDLIPIYNEVFEASDIPAVQAIGDAVPRILEPLLTIKNINNITEDEMEELYDEDENSSLHTTEPSKFKIATFGGLISDIYACLSRLMFDINASTYRMIYGHAHPDDSESDLYFPLPETYALLETDDINFKQLIALSKYLDSHRESVWD